MKKFYLILILAGLLVGFTVPQFTLAADPDVDVPETCRVHKRAADVCTASDTAQIDDEPLCCLVSSIYRVTDWIFFFLMALVVIMVLLGAFSLLTAAGDPAKIEKGRGYILWAAVGFIVALLAWTVPGIAKLVMGLE